MAKRRNKARAKRRFAGLDRKVKINGEIVEKMMKIETISKQASDSVCTEGGDPGEKVQVTERDLLINNTTDKENNLQNSLDIGLKKAPKQRGRKPNKNKQENGQNIDGDGKKSGDVTTEEVLIYPTEIDGETCLEIKCGNNDAQLYLSKLSLGSKGSCIHYSGRWLTPNEFQSVSGRETAKDWKRSIRHNGRSLKMLISKGLITVQNASPKQTHEKSSPKSPPVPPAEKPSPVKQNVSGAEGDVEKSGVGSEEEVTSAEKTNIKQAGKKRGRKPKRLRQWKAKAKLQNSGPEVVSDVTPSQTSEAPKQCDEVKNSLQNTEKTSPSVEEDKETKLADDIRAEEERRLDEFVKSLRLTKAVVAPKFAPELSTIEKVKVEPEIAPDDEPEMPVLQKEADILTEPPRADDQMNISVNVDTFHATVTPPPTPPGDKIVIEKKTDDEKLGETFKSRLTSPSQGVKLTISKVNVNEIDNSADEIKVSDDVTTDYKDSKPNMQTLLLQDALQSAKKYKEQLKQSMQTSPSKPVIRVPNVKSKTDVQNDVEKSLPQGIQPSATTNIDYQRQQLNDKLFDKNLSTFRDQNSRRHIAQTPTRSPIRSHNVATTADDMKNFTGTPFQDLLAGMSSAHGPAPLPVDTKDTGFAALQEMQRRYEMLRLLTQGQVDGTTSVLYPMMTQQILLAMTQQLYSMYNVPCWLPSSKPSSSNPNSPTPEIHRKHSLNPTEIHQRHLPQTSETQRRRMSQTPETSYRNTATPSQEIPYRRYMQTLDNQHGATQKRKHSELATDCAIDLSVKRNKAETKRAEKHYSTEPSNLSDVKGFDAPLDFSMKKTKQQEQCHSKQIDSKQTIGAFNMFSKVDYQRHKSVSEHIPEARPKVCTCDRVKEDDISSWSVEQVCRFLRDLDGCAQYAKTFHEQGISGRLLPYLTTQHLTRTLGMKVGPALTLIHAVERRIRERHSAMLAARPDCLIHQPYTMPVHNS